MLFPALCPGVKQPFDLARFRINAGKVAALMKIAFGTRQSQIIETVSAAVLARGDMLDVKWNQR